MRWAVGVCRVAFAPGRSGTLSRFFRCVNPLRFRPEAIEPFDFDSSRPVFRPASAAKVAHLTVSFLAVNPLDFSVFRGLAGQSNQRPCSCVFSATGCRGRAYYCLLSGRQQAPQKFFATLPARCRSGHFLATAEPDFAAIS
jgi:hypothetical protein